MSGHVCILVGGPTHSISVNGRVFIFEMHPYCGPVVINRKGSEIVQPGPRHRFWEAATLWAEQGRRVDETGLCVWDTEPTPIVERVDGIAWIRGYEPGKPGS